MIKLKNEIFVNGTLDVLAKLVTEKELLLGEKYAISKLVIEVNQKGEIFHELRKKLFVEYGENSEDGQSTIKPENLTVFLEKQKEITDIEESYDYEPITLAADLKVSLTAQDLLMLEQIINIA